MKAYNFEKTFKTVIAGVIKNFAWLGFVTAMFIFLVPRFLGKISVSTDTNSFAADGIVSAACVMFIYITFMQYGVNSGRETPEFEQTKLVFLRSSAGRTRNDIDEFLLYANAEARKNYELETARDARVTDAPR
jgi:hypothetical protein